MKLSIVIVIAVLINITGCASSSDIEKVASRQVKAAEYYESIGQPDIARREYQRAEENREASTQLFPMLVQLYDLFGSDETSK